MTRPLTRQQVAVRAVFVCDGVEETSEEQRIVANCTE